MKSGKIISFASLSALALFASCIDNGYDLSDIDTTAQVGVNDLVVPINIDSITLDQVLDLDSASQVKRVKDPTTGDSVYAVVEEGTFKSKDIDIPTFSSSRPDTKEISCPGIQLDEVNTQLHKFVNDSVTAFAKKEKIPLTDPRVKELRLQLQQYIWNLCPDKPLLARYRVKKDAYTTSFETPVVKVHKAIRDIDELGTDCQLTLEVYFDGLDFIDNVPCRGMKIQLPVGLDVTTSAGTYDSSTGVLDLTNGGDGVILSKGSYTFSMNINNINFKAPGSGARFTPRTNAQGEFVYSTTVEILDTVSIEICKSNFIGDKTFFDLPSLARFVCKPDMSSISVTSFTGKIKYSVEGVSVKSIALSDLPGVIMGDETNLLLKNPQIYLNINDPLASKNIYAEANVALTPQKGGVLRDSLTLDEGALRISKADNLFCLSPSQPTKYYYGYDASEWKSFKGLANMLSGSGLPDMISVKIKDPGVPEQQVTNFELGKQYGPIEGKYLFYAPLDIDKYSVIIYEDKETGWNKDGTFDKVNVTKLKVSANVTSDAPLGAVLTLTALDKDGNAIPGVDFSIVKLAANQKDQAITFEQTSGVITGLDGISIRASIASDGTKALQPTQSLKLKNVRVTVTGTYTDKL